MEAQFNLGDLLAFIRAYLSKMRRYWIVAVAASWLVAFVGVYVVLAMPSNYEATARIFVDTENVLRPLLRGLSVEKDVMNDVTLMTRAVKSRPQLEKVAREADLDLTVNSTRAFDSLITSLDQRITIQRDQQNIFTIKFADNRREDALEVVSHLVNSFVEDVLGFGEDDSQQAEKTIRAELDDYEQRLAEAERRLKNFRQANVGLMPGQGGNYYARLQDARNVVSATRAQLRLAQGRLTALTDQIEGEEPVFGVTGIAAPGSRASAVTTRYDEEIADLENQKATLLISFTEKHPDVTGIEARLEVLKKLQMQEIARAPKSAMGGISANSQLDQNPVYQNLRIQLNDTEVEVATLQTQLETQEEAAKELESLVHVVPEIEAELTQLNRDYDVVLQRYQALLVRWENLQTSKRVGSATGEVRFRIIDPPFVPQLPSGPPRVIFLAGVLVVALGTGVAVALLLALLFPVYTSIREFNFEHMNPVGSISTLSQNSRFSPLTMVSASVVLMLGVFTTIFVSMDFWVSLLAAA